MLMLINKQSQNHSLKKLQSNRIFPKWKNMKRAETVFLIIFITLSLDAGDLL